MMLSDDFKDAHFEKLFAEVAAELDVHLPTDEIRIESLSGGRSDVYVLQVTFPVTAGNLRYVLRVHGLGSDKSAETALSEYRSELKMLKELELHAKKFLSREFVEKEFWLHFAGSGNSVPVTVLRHASDRQAETEPLRSFPQVVASAISTGELGRLTAELSTAMPEIDAEWRRVPGHELPRVERTPSLASKLARTTLPDFVLSPKVCKFDINNGQLILAESRIELDELLAAKMEEKPFSSIGAMAQCSSEIARISARVFVEARTVGNDNLFAQCVLLEGALAVIIDAEQGHCLVDEHKSFAKETTLVFRRDLLKPISEVLEARGIASDQIVSSLDISRLLALRPLHITHSSHADMHCGNVMASDSSIKIIDFYNPRFRLAHSDWARLATSLVAELHHSLNAEQQAELGAGDGPEWLKESPMATRLTELLEVLIGVVEDSTYEVCAAIAIEVSRYLRYVLEGVLDRSDVFCAWCGHWAQAVSITLDQTNPPEDEPVLYDLWEESLRSRQMAGLTRSASLALGAVAGVSGDRIVSPLSDLQRRYLGAIKSGDTRASNTLLLGPTSTGKSTIAQCLLVEHLVEPPDSARPCAIYIAPEVVT